MLDIPMLSSEDFYNAIASSYDAYCKDSGIEKDTEETIKLIKQYAPKTVLEFGVGTGRFAKQFLARNPTVLYTGIDISEKMLEKALLPHVVLVQENIVTYLEQCVLERKYFDVLIGPYTELHHIREEEQSELFTLMQQVARTVILNVLDEALEKKIFKGKENQEIIYIDGENSVTTEIYAISTNIRGMCKEKKLVGGKRVNMVW